jgi:hypothetical protein
MSIVSSVRRLLPVVALGFACVSCGSKWQAHQDTQVAQATMTSPTAPEWVRRGPGCMEGIDPTRLYFVGRSHIPDLRRNDYGRSNNRVSAERIGYTVLDERDAVQSARNDVYDQVRQRLAPRNYGMTAQTVGVSVDVGQCVDCSDEVPMLSTGVEQPCNDMCARDGFQQCGSGSCGQSVSTGATLQAFPTGGASSSASACSGSCGKSCGTEMSRMVCGFRKPDYLPIDAGQIARDLNLLNIGVDSVMPALLAGMEEEEVYFEKWNVQEGPDAFGRTFAEGDDEWQSYKAWVLFSIPREEFAMIASEFRIRFESLFNQAMEFALADRARRIEWEQVEMELQLQWQKEERAWNREDERAALEHARMVDLDRIHFPGRRFGVVGSQ